MKIMENLHENLKIKQEKITPERDIEEDDVEKVLNSKPFGQNEENSDRKNVEQSKTSDELLAELFGVFGADINIPDILNATGKRSKKKKKRKHSDDSDAESSTKNKHKKSKKSKKITQEKIDCDDKKSKEHSPKEIKKEKKDDRSNKNAATSESRKSSLKIVFKDLHKSSIFKWQNAKPSTSNDRNEKSSKKDKRKDKEHISRSSDREKEKKCRKISDKKSSGNFSDFSLSDEETYRKHYEYHTSSQWLRDEQFRDRPTREWDRDKYRRGRSRDDDRYDYNRSRHNYYRRSRSRSKSRKSRTPIDKKKLLEIARRNAISMLKSGTLPRNISDNTKEKLMAKIRHGGKSIDELTNYCKKLSNAEDLDDLSSLSDSDNDGEGKPKAFHHPFEVKDRGPIVMNIRNSIPIAPKQASELKAIMAKFPVSSGKQHQKVADTWVPVTTSSAPSSAATTTVATISKPIVTLQKQIEEQLPELAMLKPVLPPAEPPRPLDPALTRPYDWKSDDHYCRAIVPTLQPPPEPPVDVSEIISQRLNAMRKLQENPNDSEASKILYETQKNMTAWAASKYTPGQFLGSTDIRVLSAKELASGQQAWAKKNQLIDTQPVTSGMGMHLLKKMGWTPGEGLGKERNGNLEPLLLELKLDKRGLEANEEVFRKIQNQTNRNNKKGPGAAGPSPLASLEQKHPVSLLGELASKRRWGAPNYQLVSETGPPHAKNFVFKVRLNGIDYTCPSPSNNKKEAKANVARFSLQQLGILPS